MNADFGKLEDILSKIEYTRHYFKWLYTEANYIGKTNRMEACETVIAHLNNCVYELEQAKKNSIEFCEDCDGECQ